MSAYSARMCTSMSPIDSDGLLRAKDDMNE